MQGLNREIKKNKMEILEVKNAITKFKKSLNGLTEDRWRKESVDLKTEQ